MNISASPLNRQAIPQGTTLATYRKELAQQSARFSADPEAVAARMETEIFESTAAQSEGSIKRSGVALPENFDPKDIDEIYTQLNSDHSVRPRLAGGELDDEAKAVLREVADKLVEKGENPADFFFQPVSLSGDILQGNASHYDTQGGLQEVYQIALHDTPGMDNALMLITPLSEREYKFDHDHIERTLRSTRGVALDQIDLGWQLHENSFPAR